ncbi:MAG: cytoplasmic protein [Planctomycetota bacterium]|nr:MAG: cytoplasmic protein [Planctomycetota bacterium]
MSDWPRPIVVVSACLGFEACRYDGQQLSSGFLELLADHVEFQILCPELAMGLGVPRPTIHIERHDAAELLIEAATRRELTIPMQEWAKGWLAERTRVDGFVLKSKSPSCGIRDTKIHAKGGHSVLERGAGFFARAAMQRFPEAAVEDEARLSQLAHREHWLSHIFTKARFHALPAREGLAALQRFQAEHKFLLQACDEARMRQLGRLVGEGKRLGAAQCFARYGRILFEALTQPPSRKSQVNVLEHCLGFLKDRLNSREKARFLDCLHSYRQGELPLCAPRRLLAAWAKRFEVSYLLGQRYFAPFPEGLLQECDDYPNTSAE